MKKLSLNTVVVVVVVAAVGWFLLRSPLASLVYRPARAAPPELRATVMPQGAAPALAPAGHGRRNGACSRVWAR